jgi:hypothetical protein
MKKIIRIALWTLLSLVVYGQSSAPALSGSCQNGGTYPSCVGGEVLFTGSNYSGQVHVKVTNNSGDVIDDGDYSTTNGILKFVENLSFAGTYTVSTNGQVMLSVTTP